MGCYTILTGINVGRILSSSMMQMRVCGRWQWYIGFIRNRIGFVAKHKMQLRQRQRLRRRTIGGTFGRKILVGTVRTPVITGIFRKILEFFRASVSTPTGEEKSRFDGVTNASTGGKEAIVRVYFGRGA